MSARRPLHVGDRIRITMLLEAPSLVGGAFPLTGTVVWVGPLGATATVQPDFYAETVSLSLRLDDWRHLR